LNTNASIVSKSKCDLAAIQIIYYLIRLSFVPLTKTRILHYYVIYYIILYLYVSKNRFVTNVLGGIVSHNCLITLCYISANRI